MGAMGIIDIVGGQGIDLRRFGIIFVNGISSAFFGSIEDSAPEACLPRFGISKIEMIVFYARVNHPYENTFPCVTSPDSFGQSLVFIVQNLCPTFHSSIKASNTMSTIGI